ACTPARPGTWRLGSRHRAQPAADRPTSVLLLLPDVRRPHGRFSDLCSVCGAHESTGTGGPSESPARTTVGTVTSALLTHLYELTMLRAARDAGLDSWRSGFEVFPRS